MSDAQLGLLTAPHHHRLCRYAEGDGRPVHHGDRIRRRASIAIAVVLFTTQ
jgi:hypothetical protein